MKVRCLPRFMMGARRAVASLTTGKGRWRKGFARPSSSLMTSIQRWYVRPSSGHRMNVSSLHTSRLSIAFTMPCTTSVPRVPLSGNAHTAHTTPHTPHTHDRTNTRDEIE